MVVNANNPDGFSNDLYEIRIDGLCNAPTVTIKPLLETYDVVTSNPEVYYSVKFNMPVSDFTDSDLAIGGTSGASKAFIKRRVYDTGNSNFIVGVNGMTQNGTINLSILEDTVVSSQLGTLNLASINTSNLDFYTNTITYSLPTTICSTPGSQGVAYVNEFLNPIAWEPSNFCGVSTAFITITNIPFNTRYHAFTNNSGSDKCIGFKVKKLGTETYDFIVYKNLLPFDHGEMITNYACSTDMQPYSTGGYTINPAYATIAAGQNFYVQVNTIYADYEIILENIPCSQTLSTDDIIAENELIVFPNPTSGIFTISGIETIDKTIIYNSLGQKIFDGNQSQIDISNFSNGIYFLEILSNGKISKQKIIKN
ncbi:MAG: T9SS type A sorting domain-containing protein [Flavobacterium sp.]|nr:T9SS type A sorting domain-containing protein [Flavobacterium sp.]